ncbi:MAG: MerC domain-containing protein [Parvularculaceae bacterium]
MTGTTVSKRLDIAASGLSAACVAHCLATPVLGAMVPFFASWAEIEWLHKALVLTAAPLSLFAIVSRSKIRGGRTFAIAALIGLGLLLTAAFMEAAHAYETELTALGGVVLVCAHMSWWLAHRAKSAGRAPNPRSPRERGAAAEH